MEANNRLTVTELPPRIRNGERAAKFAKFNTYFLFALILMPFVVYYWPFYNPAHYVWVDVPKQVQAGGTLRYTMKIEKHVDMAPQISRFLISANNPNISITITSSTLGSLQMGEDLKTVMMTIPPWTPPGKWFVRARVIYPYFGGNVPVEADYRTPIFEVVKQGGKHD